MSLLSTESGAARRLRTGLAVGAALAVAVATPALAGAPEDGRGPAAAQDRPGHGPTAFGTGPLHRAADGGLAFDTGRPGRPAATPPTLAHPSDGPASRAAGWREKTMADADATGIRLTRVDEHVTWASGMRFDWYGESFDFVPTLWERDDRRGDGWKERPTTPGPDGYNQRWNDVDASSSRSAVLVGDFHEPSGGVVNQSWNGRAWKNSVAQVPKDTIGAGFLAVDARTATDAWATGWAQVPTGDPDDSKNVGLLSHWNGTRWTAAKLPAIGAERDGWHLVTVTALAADDVWAAGSVYGEDGTRPLLVHFDGKRWSEVRVPELGDVQAQFDDLAVGRGGVVWAGGTTKSADGTLGAFALRYAAGTWKRTPLPAGTAPVTAVTVQRDEPVFLVDADAGRIDAVRGNATGTRWTPLGLADAAAPPLSAVDVLASGDTIDVLGHRPPNGGTGKVGYPVVLTRTTTS
ncbi:hypothetical protein AAHZ94_14280 [Streptomyces sp. HSW2009]|uniref:hypothetical protein n=1 Tax=Streptomyces sp. HSW2009 TaxID=3142890 RepID=UPI0032EC8056